MIDYEYLKWQIEQIIQLDECIHILRENGYKAKGSIIDGKGYLEITPPPQVEVLEMEITVE